MNDSFLHLFSLGVIDRRILRSLARLCYAVSLVSLLVFSHAAVAVSDAENLPRLSVNEMVAAAVRQHPDLATFAARLEGSNALARERNAVRYPRLSAIGSAEHFDDPTRIQPFTGNNQAGEFSRDIWSGDLVLRWTAYAGGRLQASAEAARLLEEASGADVRFFQERVATRVAQLYYEFSARKAIIRASEKSLQSLRGQARQVSQLLQQGKAAEVDRMRLDVRAATIEQSIIQQRNDRANLRASINFMVGRAVDDRWESVDLEREGVSVLSSLNTPAADLSERSDLTAARFRFDAAMSKTREAEAAWLPQLDLIGSYGAKGDWAGRDNFDRAQVGLQVSWDIWDAGLRRARVDAAQALVHEREAQLASLSESRKLDLLVALDNFASARERLKVAILANQTAAESLRIEQLKYAQGKGTVIDVLDAETAALETESQLIRADADIKINRAAVDFARGAALSPQASCNCLRQTN